MECSMLSPQNQNRFVKWLRVIVSVFALTIVGGCGHPGLGEDVESLSAAACTGVQLSRTPDSPGPAGTVVTLTAAGASCAMGETPEYRFFYRQDGATAKWTLIRDWSTEASFAWNTVGRPAGKYSLLVYTRAAGSTVGQQSLAYSSFFIQDVCMEMVSFAASPPSPQSAGASVTLTAAANCTGGTPEFQFYHKLPGTSAHTLLRDWGGASMVWNTAGYPVGTYQLLVMVRRSGNASPSETSQYMNFILSEVGQTACTSVSTAVAPSSPQPSGTSVALTANAGCTNPEYQFRYRLWGVGQWTMLRTWGAPMATWNTTGLNGLYQVLTEVRAAGSAGVATANSILNYTLGGSCPSVALTFDPASPQPVGASITLTGSATCSGGAMAEYRFLHRPANVGAYVELRTWGAASYVWDTQSVPSGLQQVQVQVRPVGTASTYEALQIRNYTLAAPLFSQVSASLNFHTCATGNNALAYCWGLNDRGQLGNGSTSDTGVPVRVSGLTGVAQVAAGGGHSCARLTGGGVQCWGDNLQGQLGNGSTAASSIAVNTGVTDASSIATGTLHTCALHSGGAVSCWGDNRYGQLGEGRTAFNYLAPNPVPGLTGVVGIAAGGWHTCALLGNGSVSCWGLNMQGQLGDGTVQSRYVPTPVTGLAGADGVATGDSHTCATSGGSALCWGDNTYNQLGDGSLMNQSAPVVVPGLSSVTQVAPGFPFTCARSAGSISCWGHGDEGELGQGSFAGSATPVAVSGLSNATTMSSGGLHSCAVLSSGSAVCWGYNAFGQLGNGTSGNASAPVTVAPPP